MSEWYVAESYIYSAALSFIAAFQHSTCNDETWKVRENNDILDSYSSINIILSPLEQPAALISSGMTF